MENSKCNLCGDKCFVVKNGKTVCYTCGAYVNNDFSKSEQILLANAWQQLRNANFNGAMCGFEGIKLAYPSNYEAYWGIVLAKYQIMYVSGDGNKKVPRILKKGVESFLSDEDYLKTISLCEDDEIKKSYIKQAEKIDEIIISSRNKKSKSGKAKIQASENKKVQAVNHQGIAERSNVAEIVYGSFVAGIFLLYIIFTIFTDSVLQVVFACILAIILAILVFIYPFKFARPKYRGLIILGCVIGSIAVLSIFIPVALSQKMTGYYDGLTYQYSIISGEVTITGAEDSANYDIPSKIDNKKVVEISNQAFYESAELKSVTIPDSVTRIGIEAFYNCDSLTSVDIGNSVTSIEEKAFYDCDALASIVIPDSVTKIWDNAFYGCYGLLSATIGDGVTSIGEGVFEYCTNIVSIKIGSSVQSIGDEAFYFCYDLKSITIPASVNSIGRDTFSHCNNLGSIIFEDTVGWYRTISESEWKNMSGGTSTSVSNLDTIGIYLKTTYADYYWYKK